MRVVCEGCGLNIPGLTQREADRFAYLHGDETCDPEVRDE